MKTTIKQKEFPFLTNKESFEYYLAKAAEKCKTERGMRTYLQKRNDEVREKHEQPAIVRLWVSITWHRSRTWGNCPTAEYRATFADGHSEYGDGVSASGCGYDKESTVIADIFEKFCLGMANRKYKRNKKQELPYGVAKTWNTLYFMGGVGESCYRKITEWLGGKCEHTGCGKTYDEYVYTFKAK